MEKDNLLLKQFTIYDYGVEDELIVNNINQKFQDSTSKRVN